MSPLRLSPVVGNSSTPSKSGVAVAPAKAKEFLAKLRRPERNIWDRRRPDVQQWIMQFTYMSFDETVSGDSRVGWGRTLSLFCPWDLTMKNYRLYYGPLS